jgi:hypothetical protein
VWNKSISEYDKKILVKITFPTEDKIHSKIDDIDLELQPGFWNLKNILDNIKGRKVIIEYSYVENNKLISNFNTYYL